MPRRHQRPYQPLLPVAGNAVIAGRNAAIIGVVSLSAVRGVGRARAPKATVGAALAVVVVVTGACAGCGGSGPVASRATTTTTTKAGTTGRPPTSSRPTTTTARTPTTARPPTTAARRPTTTAAARRATTTTSPAQWRPRRPQPSAYAATDQLIADWSHHDRSQALMVATAAAVDRLFALGYPSAGLLQDGCSNPLGNMPSACTYRYGSTQDLLSISVTDFDGVWGVTGVELES